MSLERIIGLVFSGFATKVYAAVIAVWLALEAAHFVRHAFALASNGFAQ